MCVQLGTVGDDREVRCCQVLGVWGVCVVVTEIAIFLLKLAFIPLCLQTLALPRHA